MKNGKNFTIDSLENFRPLKDFEDQIEQSFKRREALLTTIASKKKLSIVKNDAEVIDGTSINSPNRIRTIA